MPAARPDTLAVIANCAVVDRTPAAEAAVAPGVTWPAITIFLLDQSSSVGSAGSWLPAAGRLATAAALAASGSARQNCPESQPVARIVAAPVVVVVR